MSSHMMSGRLIDAVRNGLSITQAAAVLGLGRTMAYSLAGELGLVLPPRKLSPGDKRKILDLIESGELSLAEIAAEIGVGKTTVIKVRDRATAGCQGPRLTRSAYHCSGCGKLVRLRPCVICSARRCQSAAS